MLILLADGLVVARFEGESGVMLCFVLDAITWGLLFSISAGNIGVWSVICSFLEGGVSEGSGILRPP